MEFFCIGSRELDDELGTHGSQIRSMKRNNIVIRQRVDPAKIVLAKKLRKQMTPAERSFWNAVRRNQIDGLHFRRQQVISGFIVDFYCHRARLAVEIDGDVHADQSEYDHQRDSALSRMDIKVVRFSNEDVLERLEDVVARIRRFCAISPPSQ